MDERTQLLEGMQWRILRKIGDMAKWEIRAEVIIHRRNIVHCLSRIVCLVVRSMDRSLAHYAMLINETKQNESFMFTPLTKLFQKSFLIFQWISWFLDPLIEYHFQKWISIAGFGNHDITWHFVCTAELWWISFLVLVEFHRSLMATESSDTKSIEMAISPSTNIPI